MVCNLLCIGCIYGIATLIQFSCIGCGVAFHWVCTKYRLYKAKKKEIK